MNKRTEQSELHRKIWQSDLLRQIEDKKRKDDETKRKESEMDKAEEEKYQIYLQKKKDQESEQIQKRSKIVYF